MLQVSQKSDFFHVESIVQDTVSRLNNRYQSKWLESATFGDYLRDKLQQILEEHALADDWRYWVMRPVREIQGVTQKYLNLSLNSYLGKDNQTGPGAHLYWLNSDFIEQNKQAMIGNLIPDLVVYTPSNDLWVWDFSSTRFNEHMAKTILFADILSNQQQVCHIGETTARELLN